MLADQSSPQGEHPENIEDKILSGEELEDLEKRHDEAIEQATLFITAKAWDQAALHLATAECLQQEITNWWEESSHRLYRVLMPPD